MTKDQWVYSEVRKTLDTDRIILSNRYHSPLSDPNSPIGLPEQPEFYRYLRTGEEPPYFVMIEARRWHRVY